MVDKGTKRLGRFEIVTSRFRLKFFA